MAEQTRMLEVPRLDPPPRILLIVAPYYAGIADAQLAGAPAE